MYVLDCISNVQLGIRIGKGEGEKVFFFPSIFPLNVCVSVSDIAADTAVYTYVSYDIYVHVTGEIDRYS